MKLLMLGLIAASLGGCMITDDREENRLLSRFYSRADVDALTAQMVCKQAARTLVQIARCEIRR